MAREALLERGVRESLRIEGAPFPAVEHAPGADRQPRPREPALVRTDPEPQALKEPSPVAEATRADDPDPSGNPDPVVFHEYSPSGPLGKTLTNAADMSGADTEPDVIMLSGNWYCDVSDDGGATWRRLDPTTIFPETFAGGFCCDQVITYVDSIDRFVWFLQYNADAGGQGADGGFDFPNTHARLVEVDLAARTVVSEFQIWNPDYAFAYPSLALNAREDVGVLLGWGGPRNHADCAMGIIGDFVVWFRDDSTRTVQRYGDYLTTRRGRRNRSLYGAWGYFVTEVPGDPGSCTYNPFYARYGRASA